METIVPLSVVATPMYYHRSMNGKLNDLRSSLRNLLSFVGKIFLSKNRLLRIEKSVAETSLVQKYITCFDANRVLLEFCDEILRN